MILNVGEHDLSEKRHHYASLKCKVILSQGVPNHGFSGLKAIWFNNNAVHRIFDNHPETTHKHVFFYIPWYSKDPSFGGRSRKDPRVWGRSGKTPKVQFEFFQ